MKADYMNYNKDYVQESPARKGILVRPRAQHQKRRGQPFPTNLLKSLYESIFNSADLFFTHFLVYCGVEFLRIYDKSFVCSLGYFFCIIKCFQ